MPDDGAKSSVLHRGCAWVAISLERLGLLFQFTTAGVLAASASAQKSQAQEPTLDELLLPEVDVMLRRPQFVFTDEGKLVAGGGFWGGSMSPNSRIFDMSRAQIAEFCSLHCSRDFHSLGFGASQSTSRVFIAVGPVWEGI